MNWANPENLTWLWLVLLAIGLAVLAERRRRQRLAKVAFMAAGAVSGPAAGARISTGLTWLKYGLFVGCLGSLILGLARPRWGFEWTELKRRGVDLAVAVDVSRSMLAKDMSPNRIERARREIVDLLGVMRGDRIALVAFAGAAFVQCPLTLDYGAAQMFLDYLDTDLIPVQGTNIEEALSVSIGALENGTPGESTGKAVILITDGEEVSGDIAKAIAGAKEKGIKVYAVGIGSPEGAPIPGDAGDFKKDEAGNVVISRLAEAPLRDLAEETGGTYVRATATGMGLENIYRSAIKAGLEEREFDAVREKLWFERFQWFLGLALVLLMIEYALKDVVVASSRALLALVVAGAAAASLVGGSTTAHAESAPDAYQLYNEAVTSYREGKYDQAREGFTQAATDPKLAANAFYNLGNTEAALKNYEAAVAAYEKSLNLKQSDQQARDNLAWAKERAKKQNQDQQKQDQQKQEQEQDQQKQEQQENQQQEGEQQDKKEAGGERQQGEQNPEETPQQKEAEQKEEQKPQKEQQAGSENETPENKPSDQQQEGQQNQQQAQQEQQNQQQAQQENQQQAQQEQQNQQDRKQEPGATEVPLKVSKHEAEVMLQTIDEMSRKEQLKRELRRMRPKHSPSDKDW